MYIYYQLLNDSTLRNVFSVKYQRNHRCHQNTLHHKIPLSLLKDNKRVYDYKLVK